jgi:hypothetical protein
VKRRQVRLWPVPVIGRVPGARLHHHRGAVRGLDRVRR